MNNTPELKRLLELNESILQQIAEIKQDVARRNSPWMDMKEAAAYVKLSHSRFASIYKDRIPHSCPGGGYPKFHIKDLDRYLEDSKVEIY